MRILTKRFQLIQVATLATLRDRLNEISGPGHKFTIDKVRSERVAIRVDTLAAGEKTHSLVVLPAYPTGHEHDKPGNPNVVLDPVEFVHADTSEKRAVFTPLLGEDVLAYYDKLHPHTGLSMTRCC